MPQTIFIVRREDQSIVDGGCDKQTLDRRMTYFFCPKRKTELTHPRWHLGVCVTKSCHYVQSNSPCARHGAHLDVLGRV